MRGPKRLLRHVAPDFAKAFAYAEVRIDHNDWPQWRDLTAADFSDISEKVIVDGRRILRRGAMKGVRLEAVGG